LRMARAWLESAHPPAGSDLDIARRHAIDEISRGIDDIKRAVRDDGANSNFTPPPQVGGNPADPMRSALRLLDVAHKDLATGTDAPENRGLQARSIERVVEARRAIAHVIGN